MLSRNHVELLHTVRKRHTFWRWLFIDYVRETVNRCALCAQVKRERETLAKLSDAELQDIGVHRADADAESRRSFLDVPADRAGYYLDDGEDRRAM